MSSIIGYLQLLWLMKSPPALFSRLFALPWYRNMLEQWVEPILIPRAKVLEIGCAAGDFSRSLAQRGMNIWAIDRSSRMISKARRIRSEAQFKQADATQLPFPDQCFDVILAASLLNIVDSPTSVLNEMRRVCRIGGTVAVLVPARNFSDEDAKRYVATEKLTGLSAAAFTTWHRLGRKIDENLLRGYFEECGMTNMTSSRLLGGMIIAISARVSTAA